MIKIASSCAPPTTKTNITIKTKARFFNSVQYYSLAEAAKLLNMGTHRLVNQLNADLKKKPRNRRFPQAYRTACCKKWRIPIKEN